MIIAILLFLCISTKAHRILSLDLKHGFNKFDLGSKISSIKNRTSINRTHNEHPNLESYVVNYPANYKLFGYTPRKIVLDFYNGLLTQISVSMPRNESLKESQLISARILGGLGKLYGDWEELMPSEDKMITKSIIRKRTGLFFKSYPGSATKGDTFTYVSIPLSKLLEIKS